MPGTAYRTTNHLRALRIAKRIRNSSMSTSGVVREKNGQDSSEMTATKYLYTREEIPQALWEPAILGGYRKPDGTMKDCLYSLFWLHNETFNIWTHLVAMVFFVYYAINKGLQMNLMEEEYQPLLCLLVTSLIYPLGSIIAHTFNCISVKSLHIGFMFDYYGITLYAFGAAIGNKAYAFPLEWRGGLWDRYFLLGSLVTCVIAMILSCESRMRPFDVVAKLTRATGFLIPYAYGMSPCLYRAYTVDTTATIYYIYHVYSGIATVSFYLSHFPESLFPGRFDIYFHSHQVFHVTIAMGTWLKTAGFLEDKASGHPASNARYCILYLIGLTITNAFILGYYTRRTLDQEEDIKDLNENLLFKKVK